MRAVAGSGNDLRRGFFEDAADALGRKAELNQRHAAVEGFVVALDKTVPEAEPADALEGDRTALAFRQARKRDSDTQGRRRNFAGFSFANSLKPSLMAGDRFSYKLDSTLDTVNSAEA